MFGNDHYPIKLGLNKNVPFISYNTNNKDGMTLHDVNVVEINDPSERCTCIVVEDNGKFADFYYNGAEEKFKQLSEEGYEVDSWEEEEMGITPQCILDNGISRDLVYKLIEH